MAAQDILSRDIRDKLYFSAHTNGLMFHTPNGSFRLSVAAAEDLMVNFEINLETYQGMVNRHNA